MKVRLFFVPVVLFPLASSAFCQVDGPLVKNKTDVPLQITEAHCSQNAQVNYCRATLQFADTNETWDGYVLLWTVTFEDGRKKSLRQAADRIAPPRQGGKTGAAFQPREIVNGGDSAKGTGFFAKNRDGKILRLTETQVEVEFVINTNGTVWGDCTSPACKNMMARYRQAKEDPDNYWRKTEK